MEKFVLKSKTIIGLLVASGVMWAPQFGVDFSQEDGDFIMANLNEIIATGGLALAAFGRFVADSKLRFKP